VKGSIREKTFLVGREPEGRRVNGEEKKFLDGPFHYEKEKKKINHRL